MHLSFGEKRSKDGSLLKYNVFNQTKIITEEIYQNITKLENFAKLKKDPNLIFIEIYLKKIIFDKVYYIVSQIKIIEHEKKFNKIIIDLTDLNLNILKNIIKKYFNEHSNLNIKNSKITKKIYFKESKIKFLFAKYYFKIKTNILYKLLNNLYEFSRINFFQFNTYTRISKSNILVKYGEGLDNRKRSDIFWHDNRINKDNIIIFFETDRSYTNIFKFKTVLKKFKNRFHILLKANYILTDKLNNINLKKKFYNKNNKDLELWLLNQLTNFYIRFENYILFFKKTNTKILYDPYEFGYDGAIMAAASNTLDICTIGKMRSYHSEINGKLFFSHINDIHVLWGNDSLSRFLNKVNSKNYYLPKLFFLNGYSYTSNLDKLTHIKKLQNIKNNFKKNSINKVILLLDTTIENSNINKNKSHQTLSKEFAIKYFMFFFNLISQNNNLGIIVKSKNNFIFESIFKKYNLYNELKLNKKLIIINDSKGIPSSDYSEISNIVVGINADDLPSSVMECLTNCNRAVIFDYSNLSSYERKIYQIGHNRFIFNDFDKFKINFIEYLKNKNDHFGYWGKFINEIHVSSDNLGYQRVADLMYVLFNLINKNSKLESIKKLSTYLSKKYGNDKIYYNK